MTRDAELVMDMTAEAQLERRHPDIIISLKFTLRKGDEHVAGGLVSRHWRRKV